MLRLFDRYVFLTTHPDVVESETYNVQFHVSSNHHLVVDVIDYNPDVMQENLTLYDTRRDAISSSTRRWIFEDDLVDFPIESSSRYLTFEWTVRDLSSGRLTFAIRSSKHLREQYLTQSA